MVAGDFRRAVSLHVSFQVSLALEPAAALGAQVIPHLFVTLSVHLQPALAEKCLPA